MKNIITISREFGSGGRSIAKAVAKRMGYEYFDVEMMEKLAQGHNIDFEESEGPARGGSFVSNLFGFGYKEDMLETQLWNKQREMILEIAEKGNCVIVGRCADYVLRGYDNSLHVFVHADLEYRKERIVKYYGETNETPEKRIADKDKKRRSNYEYLTDRSWGAAQNYDMTLNTSRLGHERCVDIIVGLASAE